jgi:hypothetical protein
MELMGEMKKRRGGGSLKKVFLGGLSNNRKNRREITVVSMVPNANFILIRLKEGARAR